jgi:hypothetical protein
VLCDDEDYGGVSLCLCARRQLHSAMSLSATAAVEASRVEESAAISGLLDASAADGGAMTSPLALAPDSGGDGNVTSSRRVSRVARGGSRRRKTLRGPEDAAGMTVLDQMALAANKSGGSEKDVVEYWMPVLPVVDVLREVPCRVMLCNAMLCRAMPCSAGVHVRLRLLRKYGASELPVCECRWSSSISPPRSGRTTCSLSSAARLSVCRPVKVGGVLVLHVTCARFRFTNGRVERCRNRRIQWRATCFDRGREDESVLAAQLRKR